MDMAFKLLPDGTIQTDSVEELLEARAALAGEQSSKRQRANPKSRSAKVRVELSNTVKAFLVALLKHPTGLDTHQIAKAIEIDPRQVPPVIRHLTKWAEGAKVKLDDLLKRKPQFENRKPVTLYALTEDGRTTFGPMLGFQNGNGEARSETMN
jgi:hypothetical protein